MELFMCVSVVVVVVASRELCLACGIVLWFLTAGYKFSFLCDIVKHLVCGYHWCWCWGRRGGLCFQCWCESCMCCICDSDVAGWQRCLVLRMWLMLMR